MGRNKYESAGYYLDLHQRYFYGFVKYLFTPYVVYFFFLILKCFIDYKLTIIMGVVRILLKEIK